MNKKISLALLCFASLTAWAFFDVQPFTVSGKVTDESGQAVNNVTVIEVGAKNAVSTDAEGKYSITIKHAKATIRFSNAGFDNQEIKANHNLTQDIVLKHSKNSLDEVVVIGYGTSKKNTITGSVSSVNGYQLSGKPAGLYIQREQYAPSPVMAYDKETADDTQPYSREGYDAITENRFKKVTDNPLSTFSIDVDGAAYSNMRRYLENGSLPPAGAVRIEELINYFHYDYPQPTSEHPFSINTEISDCPWNTQHKLALIGLQGKIIPTGDLPASNLVFLIDVSGSMSDANKLPLVRASLKLLTEQMRSQDRVAIVVYAGNAGLVLPSTSGSDKATINKAIDNLNAGGSTAGGAGIKLAYKTAKDHFIKQGNNRIILCTDGDFNVGASSDDELERMIEEERKSGVFLSIAGFGMGNYQDAKMQKLADKGNGNHSYIDGMREARKVFVNEFGGTLFTIAKDVKLQIEFNPAKVQGYRLIGYENRMLAKEDFNNDKKDAGELGSGHTVTALYEIIPAGVDDDLLEDVDELKYQKPAKTNSTGDEMMTVKFRYKKPEGDVSQLIVHPVNDQQITYSKASENFRFAASVAQFGLLLRNSEFKQNASYKNVLTLAKASLGKDLEGYRNEFIKLVENAKLLAKTETKQEVEDDLGMRK